MQNRNRAVVAASCAIWIFFLAGNLMAQRPAVAPKPVYQESAENFGCLPPPVDLSGLVPYKEAWGMMTPPPSWDWRALGGVTSVKNQNPYGTCWAFAGLGDLESKVLISESTVFDFSEVNVVACVPVTGTTCNSGGNAWMTTNYLSLLGTVNESCNSYPDGCPTPTCINPACPYLKRVIEWRVIPNDVTAIKNAVMTFGPVYTTMYASFSGFGSYNGSYCITYTGTEAPNHAVLIVGWDDALCGGAGGWIVKNSWGTSWGDNGYFYIKYGSARIGEASSVYTGYKPYVESEKIYYYDDWGWWSSAGYGDQDDYAMVVIIPSSVPPEGELLRAVDFWATWGPTNYTIEIYDTFNGSTLSDLLAGPFSGTKSEPGFYSYQLSTPLTLHNGDAVYIKMRFNTPGYNYPIPFDDSGPMETNKNYVSNNGSSWYALDLGNYSMGDVGIRARVEPVPSGANCSWEGDPAFRFGWNYLDGLPYNQPGPDYVTIVPGGTLADKRLGPYNAHQTWLPTGYCKAADTLCFHAISKGGWTLSCNPPMGTPVALPGPGYLWYQYISITAPCSATPGQTDTIIAIVTYTNVNIVCDISCGDCADPNIRPTDGLPYYSADTLIVTVEAAPPALSVLQDTLTLIERGQTQAYVPFSICIQDPCAPPTTVNYSITSQGNIPMNVPGSSVIVNGGDCEDVYAILNAGTATVCTYDELTIIAWAGEGEDIVYDTCVQRVHVVEAQPVPVMTPIVVGLLVVALIVVVAIFMSRRVRKTS